MARELKGRTLGGDFEVLSVEAGEDYLDIVLEHGEPDGECARMELQVSPDRFKRFPQPGEKHRVAMELTRVREGDPYDAPRDPRVSVGLAFLEEVEHLLAEADFDERLEGRANSVVGSIGAMRTQLEEGLEGSEDG